MTLMQPFLEDGGVMSANTFIPDKDVLSKATEEFSSFTSYMTDYSDGDVKIYPIESPNGFKKGTFYKGGCSGESFHDSSGIH